MKKVDPAEFALVMAKAANMLYDGNTEFAMAKNNIVNGTEHTAYYDFSGTLIGISEVTIPYQYNKDHDMFFLRHMSTNPLFK